MTVYEIVTNNIIKQLDEKIVPWQKPWSGNNNKYNRFSKKGYSFLNWLILPFEGEYASFRQWNKVGGRIKKGEKAFNIVYWNLIKKEEKNMEGKEEIIIPFLRYYPVFHISQVEGVEPLNISFDNEKSIEAEDVMKKYSEHENCIIITTNCNSAYYSLPTDTIRAPILNQYKNRDEYYSTLFHEMIHSTGASNRLNRFPINGSFQFNDYGKEELIAEIGSAMLCNYCHLDSKKTFDNSISYIQAWKNALENDSHLIVNAAVKAEKAVKYILNKE